jgi:hypothetical protein
MYAKRNRKNSLIRLYKRVDARLQIYRPETFFKKSFY